MPPKPPRYPDGKDTQSSATSGTAGAPCRLLQDEAESVLPSFDALLELARAGGLSAEGRVKLGGDDTWRRVEEIPELAAELPGADPWAAWDAMDEVDPVDPPTDPGPADDVPALPADALHEASPEPPTVEELPSGAVRALQSVERKRGRFVIEGPKAAGARRSPSPTDASRSEPSAPEPAKTPPRMTATSGAAERPPVTLSPRSESGSNVIAFPTPKGLETLGAHALAPLHNDPVFDLPDLSVPKATESQGGPRWGALVLVGLVAFGLVGVVHAWVRHVATQTFAPRPVAAAVVVGETPAPAANVDEAVLASADTVQADGVGAADLDEVTALDLLLRGRMRTDIGTVAKAGDLEAALYVDLSRMNLSELKVDAVVTAWGGKKQDVPKSAEVQVGLRSRAGELDRELAAVSLIVGRYIQSYELDVARFDVLLDTGEAGVRRWPIDPAQARNYYIRRTDLASFLRNMRKTGGR